ncbi:(2Fe-2S) ferredoxin domain-containing protein [Clostridium sp. JN-1]|uniref:(2Fe-2S) ferredoxin domain-containing protein n=1 Tax=Clostridium sp. JN-1 TaxID=2483110 RepID=UPI0024308E8D|nr:(2Fe-2S) ferredoxin domain-containing protein [Clostridium sp. JN-1]
MYNKFLCIFIVQGENMIIISICVGSACYLKGSQNVIESLQNLILKYQLKSFVELRGSFCLGYCAHDVSVKINEEEKVYSVNENNIDKFFENEILGRIKK